MHDASFLVLGHRLGLHHGPLVALALENAFFALVLTDLGNLLLTGLS